MAPKITISARIEDAKLRATLLYIFKKTGNLKPVLTKAYREVHAEVILNFRRGGSFGDFLSGKPSSTFTKWKPLSPWTMNVNQAKGQSAKPLLGSRLLYGSMGTVKSITKTQMIYGTNIGYAPLHHFGKDSLVPKKAKYLALPFPGISGRPRDYDLTFVRNTKNGSKIIFQSEGAELKPLFLLRRSVRIPARPFMTIGLSRINKITKIAASHVWPKS